MPRPGVGEAVIVGRRYPERFAWTVKTGPGVDRGAVAAEVEALRGQHETAWRRLGVEAREALPYGPRTARLIRALTRALVRTTGRVNFESRYPKSAERIEAEAAFLAECLKQAAARVRDRRAWNEATPRGL
jgi:hypothetical protein